MPVDFIIQGNYNHYKECFDKNKANAHQFSS